jgi:hypothetical protein
LAEIWPSRFVARDPGLAVHDRRQVTATVGACAALDAHGWARWLAPPSVARLDPEQRRAVIDEEGWILGV